MRLNRIRKIQGPSNVNQVSKQTWFDFAYCESPEKNCMSGWVRWTSLLICSIISASYSIHKKEKRARPGAHIFDKLLIGKIILLMLLDLLTCTHEYVKANRTCNSSIFELVQQTIPSNSHSNPINGITFPMFIAEIRILCHKHDKTVVSF